LDGEGCDLPITCTWANISVSTAAELQFHFSFASTESAIDSSDYVSLSYAVDGAAAVEVLRLVGYDADDMDAFNGEFYLDVDLDNGISPEEVANGHFTTTFEDISSPVFNVSGNRLNLTLQLAIGSGKEEFGLDNLKIQQITAVPTTPCSILTPCDPMVTCTDVNDTHFECGKCPEGYLGLGTAEDACRLRATVELRDGNIFFSTSKSFQVQTDDDIVDLLGCCRSSVDALTLKTESPSRFFALLFH